jgi:hypothetical protein
MSNIVIADLLGKTREFRERRLEMRQAKALILHRKHTCQRALEFCLPIDT